MGLADPVHVSSLQQPSGAYLPRRPRRLSDRDEVIAYLTEYAAHFDLPIEEHAPVRSLEADGARFRLDVAGTTILASQVVVATGAFQAPFVPEVAKRFPMDVFQTHATGYRRASDIPAGTALSWEAVTPDSRSRRSSLRHIALR